MGLSGGMRAVNVPLEASEWEVWPGVMRVREPFQGFISQEFPPTSRVGQAGVSFQKGIGNLGMALSRHLGDAPFVPQVITLGKPPGLGWGERVGQWSHTSDSSSSVNSLLWPPPQHPHH